MTKKERGEKWDAEFIACKRHPDRRCNRSGFVYKQNRRCGSCKSSHRIDGTPAKAHDRYNFSEQRRWKLRSGRKFKKIMENR